MSSPQESVTTVNGRRCTRSRARTAAASTVTSTASPSAVATSTAVQTSAVDEPPPPPPPPAQDGTTTGPPSPPPPPPPPPPPSSSGRPLPPPPPPPGRSDSSPPPPPPPSGSSSPPPPPPPSPPASSSLEQTTAQSATAPSSQAVVSTTGTDCSTSVVTSSTSSSSSAAGEPSAAAVVPAAAAQSPAESAEASSKPSQARAATPAASSRVVSSPATPSLAPTSTAQNPAPESPAPRPEAEAPPGPPPQSPSPTNFDNVEAAPVESSAAPTSAEPAPAPSVTQQSSTRSTSAVEALPDEQTSQIIASTRAALEVSSTTEVPELTSMAISSLAIAVPTDAASLGQSTPSAGITSNSNTAAAQKSGSNGDPNIGKAVGGAVGGFIGLVLLGALLFFCLRRRRSKQDADWSEKSEESGLASKFKVIPTSISILFAKMQSEKAGPVGNPYKRHVPRGSVSSVYSNDGISQAATPAGFSQRMSRPKSERNVLRKKNSSVSSQSAFMGIIEEPFERDPTPTTNAPTTQGSAYPQMQSASFIQQYAYPQTQDNAYPAISPLGPVTLSVANPDLTSPAPTLTAPDPFASPFDDPVAPPPQHRRTPSASSLGHHPVSFAPSSVYTTNPFQDPLFIPPLPSPQNTTTYSPFPAPATTPARESTLSYATASRPGTALYPGNTARKSDPFDLDRPEVLGLRGVLGQVRESLARGASFRRAPR